MTRDFYLSRAAEHMTEAARLYAERRVPAAVVQVRKAERWMGILRRLEWVPPLRGQEEEAA